MRVIVTGAAGYLGGHVVDRLANDGHTITALVRDATRASAWLRERARVVSSDLATPIETPLLEGHHACVHLAVLWPDSSAQPEIDDITASARLFDALGRASVGHVIYVSSAAVHRPFRAGMREDDRLVGADAYGAAKIAGEAFLRASAVTHGFRASVVRAGPCVGPSGDPARARKTPNPIAAIHRALVEGERARVNTHEGRQLTSCLDLSRTIDRLLADPSAPDTLLCMSRRTTTWAEVAHALAAKMDRPELVDVTPGERDDVSFETTRIEGFLGRVLDAEDALDAHLDALIATRLHGR
jgi:nucleoside-diphosphate-sugar epimerase